MAWPWHRVAYFAAGVGLCLGSGATSPGSAWGLGMLNSTAPLELTADGCRSCCLAGSCSKAFRNEVAGVCCDARDMQCCPSVFNGGPYSCTPLAAGSWACAPGDPYSAPPPLQPALTPVCSRVTWRSCSLLPCRSSRGPADCVEGFCRCRPHYCALGGVCFAEPSTTTTTTPPPPSASPGPPPAVCNRNTEGTCRVLGCTGSLGQTDCVHGRCLCKPAYCALGGVCQAESSCPQEAGTCLFRRCDMHGAATCVGGTCVCEKGACARGGKCYRTCPKQTGGSCRLLRCAANRRAECESGACVCGEGSCAAGGVCMPGTRGGAAEAEELVTLNGTWRTGPAEPQDQPLAGGLALVLAAGFAASAGLLAVGRAGPSGLREELLRADA